MDEERAGEAGAAGGTPGPTLRPRFRTADEVRESAEHPDAPMRASRRARPAQGRKDERDKHQADEPAVGIRGRQLALVDGLTTAMRHRVATCDRSAALAPRIEVAVELRRELEANGGLRRVRNRDSKAVMLRRRQMRILKAAITVMKRKTVAGGDDWALEDDIAALADLYRDLGGSIGDLDMDLVLDADTGPHMAL